MIACKAPPSWFSRGSSETEEDALVTVIVGIVFLLAGAFVYTYNTESPGAKIVFQVEHDNRVFGVGEDETAAILLGLGVMLLALGAFRWLRQHSGTSSQESE